MYCVLSGLRTLSYDAAAAMGARLALANRIAATPSRRLKLGQDINAEMPYGPYN